MKPHSQPHGDAFGTQGEVVVPLKLRVQPLRSLRQRQRALLVCCSAVAVLVADEAAFFVALPSIQQAFGSSFAGLVAMVCAFGLPFAGLPLLVRSVGDQAGRKQLFIGGLALFAIAGLVGAVATTSFVLLAARFVQGIGAMAVLGIVQGAARSMFAGAGDQHRALAVLGVILAFAAVPGLLVGALACELVGWRGLLVFDAVVAAGFAVAVRQHFVEASHEERDPVEVPWVGVALAFATCAVGVGALLAAVAGGSLLALGLGVCAVLGVVISSRRRARGDGLLVPPVALEPDGVWPTIVGGLLAVAPAGVLLFGALYLQQRLDMSPLWVGVALLPMIVTGALVTVVVAPWMIHQRGRRLTLALGIGAVAVGLVLMGGLGVDGGYWSSFLPSLVLVGAGCGLGVPATVAAFSVRTSVMDADTRSVVAVMAQRVGVVLGVALMALPLGVGAGLVSYGTVFMVGAALAGVGLLVTLGFVRSSGDQVAPSELDPDVDDAHEHQEDLNGVVDADFLALGLGCTNMMAMLWSIAMGRRAVGVELRGSPTFFGMQWTLREDLYHHLSHIDRLMLERYGEDRLPRMDNGAPFLLGKTFFSLDPNSTSDAKTDEVLTGFIEDAHVASLVEAIEHIDDRWVDGRPERTIKIQGPVPRPSEPDQTRIGRSMADVLAENSAFQIAAKELLVLLRRYLAAIERLDMDANLPPRCRLLCYHRVVAMPPATAGSGEPKASGSGGFVPQPDGRMRIFVEPLRELEGQGHFRRVRIPGSKVVDLGVPELFMIAEGADGPDPARLGFEREPITIDHQDGRGPVVAQADYLFSLMSIHIGGRFRGRISSVFDANGDEYWIRQAAVGHEDDAEMGWFLTEVAEFTRWDPIAEGLVPANTPRDGAAYYGGYQRLALDYFFDQASVLTEIPRDDLVRISVGRRPTMFSVVARMGKDAKVASNGVVAGDSFGNGHILTSGGVNTGAIGHGSRVLEYWQARDAGTDAPTAIRTLADRIKQDTTDWVNLSLPDFEQPRRAARVDAALLDAKRMERREIDRVDHRDDWSRINRSAGRLYAYLMPAVSPVHPAHRAESDQPPAASANVPGDEEAAMAMAEVVPRGRFANRAEQRKREQQEQANVGS